MDLGWPLARCEQQDTFVVSIDDVSDIAEAWVCMPHIMHRLWLAFVQLVFQQLPFGFCVCVQRTTRSLELDVVISSCVGNLIAHLLRWSMQALPERRDFEMNGYTGTFKTLVHD